MNYILWLIGAVVLLLLALLLIAVIRTALTPKKTAAYRPAADEERALGLAEKLSAMVKTETVSRMNTDLREKYLGFHQVLEELFPLVHEHLEKIEIDGNLLFFWEGKAHDRPLVLISHQDVVPAEGTWTHPPFSGEIEGGRVWGRGSVDTKCSLMGLLEAAEELLAEGYVPEQDVWLSSSCTEEWAGDGCPKLVDYLEKRGVRPYLVCDEGGAIITDPIGGIPGNFAMIGVFEKGKGDIRFTAKSTGGHASAPAKGSPIARLAGFVHEMETRSPFRKYMSREVENMFGILAPYASSFGLRLVLENIWLFRPVLLAVLPSISAQAGAMLKTTIAFTMQSGSDACNVMPEEATLGANMRFIPHQGMEESLAIVRQKAEKYGLGVEILHANDFSQPVDIKGDAFRMIVETTEKTFPGIVCSPYVMTGATDAINYQRICDNVIRFAPIVMGPDQMKGMHGVNEYLEYSCLPGCVDFYRNLIKANH